MTAKKCRGCKRPLTTRSSQELEWGPKCWRDRQPVPVGKILAALPLARRALEVVEGQLEITLEGERE